MLSRPTGATGPAIRSLLWFVAAAYVAFVGWELAQGYVAARRGETPRYTDYTSLYAASLLVRTEPPENLYRPRQMYRANVEAAHSAYGRNLSPRQAESVGYSPWMYPPPYILFAIPLAYLPYLLSFVAWIGVTALPYVAAIRTIIPGRDALPFGLAAPPVFFNLAYGQSGFLSGGLIGLGLALIRSRPALAGLCIGLASVKPHFGVLIPIALAAGGHWRVFGFATLTVAGLIALSVALLGADPWYGFIGTLLFHLDGFEAGAYTWHSMTSVLSTGFMAGIGLERAWTLQYLAAGLIAATTATVWYRGRQRPDTLGLQAAIVCFGTPLVVPMAYLYDLVLIVPGAAWLWMDLRTRGAKTWETALLATAMTAILGVFLIAAHFDIQTGAIIVATLLGLSLHRYRDALRHRPGKDCEDVQTLANRF